MSDRTWSVLLLVMVVVLWVVVENLAVVREGWAHFNYNMERAFYE